MYVCTKQQQHRIFCHKKNQRKQQVQRECEVRSEHKKVGKQHTQKQQKNNGKKRSS